MAVTVAQLVAVLEGRNESLKRATRESESELKSVGSAAESTGKKVSSAMDEASSAMQSASGSSKDLSEYIKRLKFDLALLEQQGIRNGRAFQNFKNACHGLGQSLQGMGILLSVGITAPLTLLGKTSLETAARFDSLERGLVAVTHSTQKAAAEIKMLDEVAKLPGLGLEEARAGAVNLQAAGLSANQAIGALMGFGNALAIVGKGKADLDGVSLALTQIAAKGKVSAEEINQLQERVPQIRQIMKDAFGTADTEKLQKMGIGADEFINKITIALLKLPKVTGGIQNDLENFQDTMKRMFNTIGQAIIPVFSDIANKVLPVITDLTLKFSQLPPSVKSGIVVFAGLAAAAGPLILMLGGVVAAIGSIAAASETIGAVVAAAFGPVGLTIAAIAAGVALLATAWKNDWGQIQETVYDVVDTVKPYLESAWDFIRDRIVSNIEGIVAAFIMARDAFKVLIGVWGERVRELTAAFRSIRDKWTETWDNIKSSLQPIVTAFQTMSSMILDIIDKMTGGVISKFASLGDSLANWWNNTPLAKYLGSVQTQAAQITAGIPGFVAGMMPGMGQGQTPASQMQPAGAIGTAVAQHALEMQMRGDYQKYTHMCQQLARTTVDASTDIFKSLWDRNEHASALTNLAKFVQAGIAEKITPDTKLSPGALLYSVTLNKQSGHVQTVGPAGERFDQYGKNKFSLSDFQYIVRPDDALNASLIASLSQQTYTRNPKPEKHHKTDAEKAAEKARREAEAHHKQLMKQFSDEMISLQREAAGYDFVTKAAAMRWETENGKFAEQTPRRKELLIDLAHEVDLHLRQQKINDITNDQLVAQQSHVKQIAIQMAGGIKQWQEMGKEGKKAADGLSEAQHQFLDLATKGIRADAVRSAKEALKDLTLQEKLLGQEAKAAAIQAAGGIEAWKALGDGTSDLQKQLIYGEGLFQTMSSLYQMQQSFKEQSRSAFMPIRDSAHEAEIAIQSLLEKWGIAADDPRIQKFLEDVKNAARDNDRASSRQFMYDQSRSLQQRIDELQDKMAGIYGPAEQAVREWERQNKDAIDRLIASTDWDTATAEINKYEDALRNLVNTEQKFAGQMQMRDMMKDLIQKANQMRAADPFKAWIESLKIWDQTLNKGKGGFRLPTGMDEGSLKQIYDWQQKLDFAIKAAQGIENVLTDAFNNAYEHGFKGFFTSVADGFKRLMYQLAVEYLMSQFVQMINRAVAGRIAGSDPSTQSMPGFSGGGFNWMGAGMSLLSMFLPGAIASGFAGGGAPAPANPNYSVGTFNFPANGGWPSGANMVPVSNPPPVTFSYAKDGGDLVPGVPTLVGDGGEPEILISKTPGRIIPLSKIAGGSGSGGGQSVVENHYHVHVTVPDVGHVRRSAGIALQEAHNMASRAAVRNRR